MKTKVTGDARLTMVARWPLWPWGVSLDNAGMLSIQQKFQFEVSEIPCALNGMAHSGCTDPTQATTRLVIVLVGKIQKSGTGDNSFASAKGHVGLTDRNDQTGQRGPPSKVFPNIPVGPNQNGPFHLKDFRNFWLNGKSPRFEHFLCPLFGDFDHKCCLKLWFC